MARREADLHFLPDWVEAIAGDGIDHGKKRLVSRQAGVGLVDEVEGRVVLKQGPFSGRREFHELDVEQVAVVISGYYAGRTVRAPSPRTGHERQCQGCPDHEFENMLFHMLASLKLRRFLAWLHRFPHWKRRRRLTMRWARMDFVPGTLSGNVGDFTLRRTMRRRKRGSVTRRICPDNPPRDLQNFSAFGPF